jgi:2',3'-cyclic-nucleotide 2'-phosphodiesterase (5'-nucleotidase family)
MGNVVSIMNRKEVELFNGKLVTQPSSGVEYLFVLKEYLAIEDYEEVLLSIMDEDYYREADKQVQAIVDAYFSFPI